MNKLLGMLKFLITNFGPLLGFYLVNHFWGFKAGVIASIFVVLVEMIWLRVKKQRPSLFFYFSSAVVLVFGTLDLTIQDPFFFKLEAPITNLLFAVFFGLSLFKNKSIVQELAESQGRVEKDDSEDKKFFFNFYTTVWVFYFLMKAAVYLWINWNSSLEGGLIMRMIIGKGSFVAMMFFSIGMPRVTWKIMRKLKLFPSQRAFAIVQG